MFLPPSVATSTSTVASVSQSGWRAPSWGEQSHAGGGAKHEVGLAVVHLHNSD